MSKVYSECLLFSYTILRLAVLALDEPVDVALPERSAWARSRVRTLYAGVLHSSRWALANFEPTSDNDLPKHRELETLQSEPLPRYNWVISLIPVLSSNNVGI